MNTRERVLEVLENIRPDVDFPAEEHLIDDGLLDSFDIITTVSDLNMEFNISINVAHLMPENFNTVEAMVELVEKLSR